MGNCQQLDVGLLSRSLQRKTDQALLNRLDELLMQEHAMEVELLLHIGEVDRRGLYRERAFSSMFQYCTQELHVAESVAYKRIRVARAAREYPILLCKIAERQLHLSGACLLVPHLTPDNANELVTAATHKSKRAIEKLLADRFPCEDAPARVRKLPLPRAPQKTDERSHRALAQSSPTPAPSVREPRAPVQPGLVAPLGLERYKIQFTADAQLRAKLEKAQDLLGPSVGRHDLAAVFSKALDLLISDLENKKHGVTSRPRRRREPQTQTVSRSIPRSVRREVYERDGGQCAFVSPEGRRCNEKSGLEYHHRVPFGFGGESTVENLELRCKSHNQLAAERDYGEGRMSRYWPRGVRESRSRYRVFNVVARLSPGTIADEHRKGPLVFGH
jgi:5-methylcytosine-specific restriction endonuclease McrA